MLRNCVKRVLVNTSKVSLRHYSARRALLYVPSDDSKKLQKGLALDADCVTMDCEDGVALNKKGKARLNIRSLLDKGKPSKKRSYDLAVRINAMQTEFFEDDLRTILTAKNLPDTLLLPKIQETSQLKAFAELVNKHIKAETKIQLIICIESALAFVNLEKIIREAINLSNQSKFVPVGLLFGSDDFCASIGATRTEESSEVLYARQKLVLYGRAFNLQIIDMVYIKYKDLEGLARQATEGARLGFTGKQVIHPDQVAVVQNAFFPSRQTIEWAAGLLKAFHQHQQEGKGAFSYEGSMIDMPTVRQAQNIMDLVNTIMRHDR